MNQQDLMETENRHQCTTDKLSVEYKAQINNKTQNYLSSALSLEHILLPNDVESPRHRTSSMTTQNKLHGINNSLNAQQELVVSDDWNDLLASIDDFEYISPDVSNCPQPSDNYKYKIEPQPFEYISRELNSTFPTTSTILDVYANVPAYVLPSNDLCQKSSKLPSISYNGLIHANQSINDSSNTQICIAKATKTFKRKMEDDSDCQCTPDAKRSRRSWAPEGKKLMVGSTKPRGQSARKAKTCSVGGCTKGSRSRGLCKRHGGGKRCTYPSCTRSDQGGGFCIAHGGGRRCAMESCKNSAQSRGLCKRHGGGRLPATIQHAPTNSTKAA